MSIGRVTEGNINRVFNPVMSGIVAMSILTTGGKFLTGISNPNNECSYFGTKELNVINSKSTVISPVLKNYHYSKLDHFVEAHIINDEKMKNLIKLDRIAMLPKNWNQDGAPALSDSVVSYARQLLTYLDIQPEVFPTAANSIQFEYDCPDGTYIEFEIKEEYVSFYSIDRHGVENNKILQKNAILINQLVDSIYG